MSHIGSYNIYILLLIVLNLYSCPIYIIVFKYGVRRINQILIILMFYKALQIIYKINRFENIDYIYTKLNILKFNDLKKVYMLNYMYKAFHNKLPNIVQVKYVKKYSRYNFRNDKLFHIKMSKLNTKIKCLSISGCIIWNRFDLIIKYSIT